MKLSILAVLAVLATPAAAADDLLSSLAGTWIGRGFFARSAESEHRLVYCKIVNTLAAGGNALSQTGRCALGNNSAAMDLTITALGGGRYTGLGRGQGIASRGKAEITGRRAANRLSVSAVLTDTQTKRSVTATATFDLSPGGGFRMRARTADRNTGADYVASEMVFAAE